MEIAVLNRSKTVTDKRAAKITAAVNRQVQRDVLPVWGGAFADVWVEFDMRPEQADWQIFIVDDSTVPGALGWHSIDADGEPYGEVSAAGEPSVTLSHEVLEIIADPGVNRVAVNWFDRLTYAMEICDPVQRNTYQIDDVTVSDFVTPAWFGFVSGKAAFSSDVEPWQVDTGGFAVRWDQQWNDQSVGRSSIDYHVRPQFRHLANLYPTPQAPAEGKEN